MEYLLLALYWCSMLVSAIFAFVYRKELKERKILILMPFLFYVFTQEVVLYFGDVYQFIKSNTVVYNIYRPLSAVVLAIVYFAVPIMKQYRRLILVILAAYFILQILNYAYIMAFTENSSYLSLTRGFVMTLFGILFLFSYFNLDNAEDEKHWRPFLWLTIGIVIFYPVISISVSFQKFLAEEKATFYGVKLYQVIPRVMSIFMYSCFSYAFYLCGKRISR